MTLFPEWQRFAVPQRNLLSGCIPTGYEFLLRCAGVSNIDFTTFQEEFDLGPARNHFVSVAEAIQQKYPWLNFKTESFEGRPGEEKLRFVLQRLRRRQPTLISLALVYITEIPDQWHIMPVVDADDTHISLLWVALPDGRLDVKQISQADFVKIHNECPGGVEVSYLEDDITPLVQ